LASEFFIAENLVGEVSKIFAQFAQVKIYQSIYKCETTQDSSNGKFYINHHYFNI